MGCARHSDCSSNACLPEGICGDDSNVAYVAPNGTNNVMCTRATPCNSIANALVTMRPHIKLTGMVDVSIPGTQTVFNAIPIDRPLTFIADPGTTVRYIGTANAFNLIGNFSVQSDNPDLRIYDLTITSTPSLTNKPVGISLTGGKLTLRRSRIVGLTTGVFGTNVDIRDSTIARNERNGITLRGKFSIVNSIIAENGSATSDLGAIRLEFTPVNGVDQIVESSTIMDNRCGSCAEQSYGIDCSSSASCTNVRLGRNNILGNARNDGVYDFSLFASGAVSGANNVTGTAMFASKADPLSPTYYRLAPGSDGIDRGDPVSPVPFDIDGDPRPQGAGVDMGADELKP
ncbi:MAG: hypothetical protein KIT31_15010 [Deltaproteobacteria bacterium]|nr:hypothetical protein [Deltaproteobacteria bacterium]